MSDYEDILYKYDSHEAQALLTKSNMLFDEVLRYGVYVYDLVFEYNKEIDGMSNTILGLLFREAMEVTDGIGVLMRSGCVAASWPLVRSFFELYAQIAVMVKDDSESSAMAYMFVDCMISRQ